MIDYKLLRKKLDEKRYDEITKEEQEVLNEVVMIMINTLEPLFEQLFSCYSELINLLE